MSAVDDNVNIMITFPDGNKREFVKGINGLELAKSISKTLERKAIALKINNEYKDLVDTINIDADVEIVTIDTSIGLDIMRHTLAAQVLAKALKNLYPDCKLAVGPTIENGFYYDVLFAKPISAEDLPEIEKEMKNVVKTGNNITKILVRKKEAIKIFDERDE